ncbi:hypothetical protein D3C87_447850 [compost metagenome]
MKKEDLVIKDREVTVTYDTANIFKYCSTFADTEIPIKYSTEIMVELFNLHFMKDLYDIYSEKVVSKSNLTRVCANVFFKVCQLLNCKCDFEAENRHDGVMRETDGQISLCAEWEIDESTILGDKGELNKLIESVKKHKTCDAFLFTYNVKIQDEVLIKNVYDYWNKKMIEHESYRLFFVTSIFEQSSPRSAKIFMGLRTFVIGIGFIDIWEDLV